MAHHAPKAIAAAEIEHAGGRTLGESWRADGTAKELEEEEGAKGLAMEFLEVDGKRVG